jgi:hypothetical protein
LYPSYDDALDGYLGRFERDAMTDLWELSLLPAYELETTNLDVVRDALAVYDRLVALAIVESEDHREDVRGYLQRARRQREMGGQTADSAIVALLEELEQDAAPTLRDLALDPN